MIDQNDSAKSFGNEGSEKEINLLEGNTVRLWQKRIKDAKRKFEKDFKRMKENMEFAAGIQRHGQENIESSQYTANFVNKEINQKVAALYAKEPKAIAKRRPRLDFEIWDGSVEKLQAASMVMAQTAATGMVTPAVPQAQALLQDVQAGKQRQEMISRVCDTMEILYQYECDTQSPDFKYQMKQLVRRTAINGVGYVRLNFCRTGAYTLPASGSDDSLSMRIKRAKHILQEIEEDKITEDDPRRTQLQQLFASVQDTVQEQDYSTIEESLEFDFPSSTSIIVDPRCKSLKGFIGARWIAQQFIMPLEEANAFFETDIKAGGELILYAEEGVEKIKNEPGAMDTKDPQEKPLGCFWEVFDITTKTCFFICDGWHKFVQAPRPVEPNINRFWPIFALTLNDIEMESSGKATIYPPSDVDLIKDAQKEWNRIGEELRKHRKSNRPFYITLDGWLSELDVDKLGDHETCELVRVKGMPPGGDLKSNLVRFDAAPIDAQLYSRANLLEDVVTTVGTTQAAPPQKHVAATPAVIQEQQRISGVSSNVDDLDDLLSELARAGGEIMLKEFSIQTVKRIAGPGAVWPEQQREDFLNEVFLDIVASSSGRPNKAVDVSTAQTLGPLMMQAGANPWALIQYYAKIMDSNLDPKDFAPVTPPAPPQAANPPAKPPQNDAQRPPGMVGQQQGGIRPVPVMQGGAR